MQCLRGSQLKSQRNLAYKGILVSKVCLQNVLETYNFSYYHMNSLFARDHKDLSLTVQLMQ